MKQIKSLVFSLLILATVGCSDGTQVGQKVNQLIKENNIESLVIQTETKNGQIQKKEIIIGEKTFENQFIQFGGEYINMGRIKSMKVNGNVLEIKI